MRAQRYTLSNLNAAYLSFKTVPNVPDIFFKPGSMQELKCAKPEATHKITEIDD